MRKFMPMVLLFWLLGAVFCVWVAGPEAPLVSLASASALPVASEDAAEVANTGEISADPAERVADPDAPSAETHPGDEGQPQRGNYHESQSIHLAGAMRLAKFGSIPWAAPGGERPRGSILLAYTEQSGGPQVIEWDLARKEVARRVPLGLSRLILDVQMARAGEAGVVLVSSAPGGPVVATLLSPDLAVRRSLPLGRGSGAVIVASEQDAYLAWLEESGVALSIVRMDIAKGIVRARVSLPLEHKIAASEGVIGALFLVRGELWLRSYGHGGLMVLSPGLAKRRGRAEMAGNLFMRAGALWTIQRDGHLVRLTELGADLADGRQEEYWWGNEMYPSAAYDGRYGLAFSDGSLVNAFGERSQLTDFFDAQSVFWVHGSLVALAASRKRGVGFAEWSGGE